MSRPVPLTDNSPNNAWIEVSEQLQKELPRQSFLTWFKPLKPLAFNGSVLTLIVPSRFYYDWIEGHYRKVLQKAVSKVLGSGARIDYSIDQIDNGHSKVSSITENNKTEGADNNSNRFETHLNQRNQFYNFVEGDCNRFAKAASFALAESPGMTPYNPLMIYGGSGLGKTHLIQAIGNYIVGRKSANRVLYVTSEQFTTSFIEAIKKGKADSFSRLYRSVDVLLLDDVQFFMAKEKTQEEFFHTFNYLHHAGKQLVFSSDRPPRDLEGFDERLVSRLQWGLITELLKPEYETRLAILKHRSEEENVNLPDEVADFLALHITDNVRTLQSALIHLFAQSSLMNRDISINLAKNIVNKLVKRPVTRVSIERIQEITSEELDISCDILLSKSRKKDVVFARQIAMLLCTEFTKSTLKAIGLQFGGRDHATVIHARETINEKIKTDQKISHTVQKLRQRIELASL